jgi:hypothetical protein
VRSFQLIILMAAAAALSGALYSFGWFTPADFPDTQGYLLAGQSANPWGELRHPLYGWWLNALATAGPGNSAVPAIQFIIHVAAAVVLYGACRFAGIERIAALALALAAILSQCLMIWGRAVLPEMLSVSLLLVAMAAVVAGVQQRWFLALLCVYAVALGLSYTLRPIMLPAILVLPLLFALLSRIVTREWFAARTVLLLLFGIVPFLGQSLYRLNAVGDFGLVSFGGFGISGMTVQMLTPDVIDRVPDGHRPLARQMLEAKDKAVSDQTAAPLFHNSGGQRSFQTTALDGFDALARNYDAIMWGKLMTLRNQGESWVAFNARMGAVNGAILRALPERWGLWVIGASSRLIGRLITYNAAFLAAMALFGLAALANITRSGAALGGSSGANWTTLTLITMAWVLSTTPLTVIATFPALRYVDTGGMLLTALPLYGLFLALRKTSSDAPA